MCVSAVSCKYPRSPKNYVLDSLSKENLKNSLSGSPSYLREIPCLFSLFGVYCIRLKRDRQIRRKEGMPMLKSLWELLIGIIANMVSAIIIRFLESLK